MDLLGIVMILTNQELPSFPPYTCSLIKIISGVKRIDEEWTLARHPVHVLRWVLEWTLKVILYFLVTHHFLVCRMNVLVSVLTGYCSSDCCFEVWHSFIISVFTRTLSTSDDVEDRENEKGRLEEAYEKCDRDLDELIVQHYTELTTAIRTYQSITERITNSRNKIKQVNLLSSCLAVVTFPYRCGLEQCHSSV